MEGTVAQGDRTQHPGRAPRRQAVAGRSGHRAFYGLQKEETPAEEMSAFTKVERDKRLNKPATPWRETPFRWRDEHEAEAKAKITLPRIRFLEPKAIDGLKV